MSQLTFTVLGGGAEIGANSFLIEQDGRQVVLDCGTHPKKDGLQTLPNLSYLSGHLEGVIITHGHIDHCGALPYLMKMTPTTECFATQPTLPIMDRMLHNSVSVMGTLAIERGIREYPLFTHGDVESALRRAYGLPMGQEFAMRWGSPLRASFHPAGHVLGAAGVLLKMREHTVYYTGDVCLHHQEILGEMELPEFDEPVHTVIVECTRGADAMGGKTTFAKESRRFAKEASKVLKMNGSVLVPAFALGRTQELLNVMLRLIESGLLPNVPVYASGLGRAIYEIYSKYPHYLRDDAELRPLSAFERIGDVWERGVTRELLKRPCVIVATSGMMVENTPSAMIAQEMVKHENHGIFFVGYLDPETLGYKVLHAKTGDVLTFEVSGRPVEIKLENRQRFDFSAHAPRDDLVRLVDHFQPENLIFNHGDLPAIEWMRENCTGSYRKIIPSAGEHIVLDA